MISLMSLKKYALSTILIYGVAFFIPVAFISSGATIPATTVSYIAGAILMIFLYFKQNEPLSFERKQPKVSAIIVYGLTGIIAAILLQNFAVFIESLFGEVAASQNTENIITIILQNPIFALAAMIGGPIMEEFVFRRAIFGSLEKRFGFFLPALLSSALFAFAHNDGHYLLYAGLGCLFCGMYRYSGRIWTSMITHVGMNLLVILTQLALQS